MAKKKVEKTPMKIFVGIPSGLSNKERAAAKEIAESKYGAEFGTYVYPVRNSKVFTILKYLAGCDAAIFTDGFERDDQLVVCEAVCKAFNIPIYK